MSARATSNFDIWTTISPEGDRYPVAPASQRLAGAGDRAVLARDLRATASKLVPATSNAPVLHARYSTCCTLADDTGAAVLVVGAALWLPQLGAGLTRQTGLGEAFVGSLFIALATSLPEIVVSLAAVHIGAIDLGIRNVLGSNLFNLFILGLDDVFYRQGPLLAEVDPSHGIAVLAVVTMNALFLIGLTYRVITKRCAVAWDTGAIAAVYVTAVALVYSLRG